MDLLSFEGEKALVDLSQVAAVISCIENHTHLIVNEQTVYEQLFSAADRIELFNERVEQFITNMDFFGGIDEDDLVFLERNEIDFLRHMTRSVASVILQQLKDGGYYSKGILLYRYRGCLSTHTGVLFKKGRMP